MKLQVRPARLSGSVRIPASKSHTIRGLLLGTLAEGGSVLLDPLRASDTESCLLACRALGARINDADDRRWEIEGTGGRPTAAVEPIDVGNSGTTLFLAMSVAALTEGTSELTGDDQIRRRSAAPLLTALRELGATAYSMRGNDCAPLIVGGGLHGGIISIDCPTSQYLSSLLIACPLAPGDTTIVVPLLHEKPYVGMTLSWLDAIGIRYEVKGDMDRFVVPGRQHYRAFERAVAGDFSSATFFLAVAAVTGSRLVLEGLDMEDTQGDRAVVRMLQDMGCELAAEAGGIAFTGPDELSGGTFDLNATPDALPAMAVAGCAASGETRLVNVPQARMKETDRIAVMARELARMGADVEEMPDGLIVRASQLHGTEVDGHADHRVVMALAVAGMFARGVTTISGAEAVSVTFPNFMEQMTGLGAEMRLLP